MSWWDTPDGIEAQQAYDNHRLWPWVQRQVGVSVNGPFYVCQKAELPVDLKRQYVCPCERYRASPTPPASEPQRYPKRNVTVDMETTIVLMFGDTMPDLAPWLHLLKRKT